MQRKLCRKYRTDLMEGKEQDIPGRHNTLQSKEKIAKIMLFPIKIHFPD
jgi:hypothetical protein